MEYFVHLIKKQKPYALAPYAVNVDINEAAQVIC